ncbi:MAG: glycerol kinase, partial [Bacteroidota bacterium]
ILDHIEGVKESALNEGICFGTIDTWLIWKMTNGKKHLTDFTNASRTMLYDIVNKKWDNHILSALEIPAQILPSVQKSSSDFGKFEYEGFEIPIGGVAGDQQAALFGQACFEEGMAKNTYGTGCFLLMNIGKKFAQSTNGLLTTLACDDKGEVCYALEGSVFIAGAGVQWLRDGLKIIKNASDTDDICSDIKNENDLIVVPAFAGLGAPYWDMEARGAILGITRGTTEKQIVKATVDAIAYQTKDIINAMQEDMKAPMKELKVDGGAVANNYLMQFQSDILQVPVERPEIIETTAMGAAYLAGMHVGIWDSNTILQNRKVNRKFLPNFTSDKINELYGKWQMAIRRVMLK